MSNNNDKKVLNVPALRFPKFTDEWEETELQNIVPNICAGKDKHSNDGTIVLYGSTGIIGMTTNPSYTEELILVARVGANAGQLQVTNTPCGVTDNTLVINAKSWNLYIYYYLQHYNLNRLVFGSGQPLITGGMLKKIKVMYGIKSERDKITHMLCILDERIKLQNKIIEDLKKLKSSIIEILLCNQNGESFKLGDVGCFVRGLTYANEDVTEDKAATTVIRANNLNYGNYVDKGEIVYVNKKPTASQILRKGDIVICMANGSSALVGKNSYYPFDDRQSTIGAFCGIYRTSHPFVKWLMQSQRYKKQVYQSLQGGNGAIANLNGNDILNISFPLIKEVESQSIIFTINAIEKSIAVNKCLHRLYCTQKSYLLAQMFI